MLEHKIATKLDLDQIKHKNLQSVYLILLTNKVKLDKFYKPIIIQA